VSTRCSAPSCSRTVSARDLVVPIQPTHASWRGCGVKFKRWVTAADTDEDLLGSAPLAFDN
jgi:hypothetical protein